MNNENAIIQHHEVCIANLSVKQVGFMLKDCFETRRSSMFDTVLLVVKGSIRAALLEDDVYTEFVAPHMVIMEKDKEYIIHALEDDTLVYDISALRTSTGDIVNPENLVRSDYPLNTYKPFEEQQK